MAETVQKKSSGMKFAEQQLLRHGWEQGKGLGREENGISEAIKVKVKCDKGGVGHHQGEQFTFHWWDHVFNKASSSLEVESDQNGVKVKKLVEEEEDGMISNKKPRKASLAKAKLYGCFVKSATLLSGQEQPEQKSSSDDSSSSDDEDQRLDLSSTTKLTDADLLKACGGRTAHKGARHGLTMSAKLARLEEQEQEFMMKYGKRNQPASQTTEVEEEPVEEIHIKKAKRKQENNVTEDKLTDAAVIGSTDVDIRLKKNKKKSSKRDTGEVIEMCAPRQQPTTLENEADNSQKTKRKRSKKKRVVEEDNCHLNGVAYETSATPQRTETAEVMEAASIKTMEESLTEHKTEAESNSKKKKKKKSSKITREATVVEETVDSNEMENQTRLVEDEFPKKKRDTAVEEKREKPETTEEEPKIKRKKKKCKVKN